MTLRFGKEKTAAKLVSAFERKTRMPVGRNERKAPQKNRCLVEKALPRGAAREVSELTSLSSHKY